MATAGSFQESLWPVNPALNAANILTADAGNYFEGTDVEAQLQELAGAPVGQFGLVQGGIVSRPYRVTATGTPAGLSGPCLVESIKCIVVGTTTAPALHDDVDAATATKLRWTRPIASLEVGDVLPLAGIGGLMTFETGVYFTCPTSGEYIINAVVEV